MLFTCYKLDIIILLQFMWHIVLLPFLSNNLHIILNHIYKIGQTQFKISDALLKAQIKIVSDIEHKIPKEQ